MEKNSTENNASEEAISLSFEECGIEDNLLAEIEKHGWKKPTPVQGPMFTSNPIRPRCRRLCSNWYW